jgi:hypothetical protein
VLSLVLLGGGCGGSDEPLQLGAPPTRDWPLEAPCPESLRSECAGRTLVLVSTVNEFGDTAVSTTIGDDALVVCRWPVAPSDSCEPIAPGGASVTGEAALYAIADD